MINKKHLKVTAIILYLIVIGFLFFCLTTSYLKLEKSRKELEVLRAKSIQLQEEYLKNQIAYDLKMKEEYKKLSEAVEEERENKIIKAFVTAFNTTVAQTDGNPCQAKFGYICGRDDVVACPRNIPAHTKVKILEKEYECLDWTNSKYNGRFDISFDKDIQKAIKFGKKYLSITIYE